MSTSKKHPRAAAMGYMCDCVFKNPNYHPDKDEPLLIRCHDAATVRLVVQTPDDVYAVKRCQPCAEILHAEVALGSTIEILAEETL